MKNESKAMLVVTVYILIMLIVCVVAITNIKNNSSNILNDKQLKDDTENETVKEIVYVPVYTESEAQNEEDAPVIYYNIKAYEGKIGVFSENGALLKIIDTNIKSLPKADRDLLEKGFCVKGQSKLLSIIEDYTG